MGEMFLAILLVLMVAFCWVTMPLLYDLWRRG